jgi:hypothetical protein
LVFLWLNLLFFFDALVIIGLNRFRRVFHEHWLGRHSLKLALGHIEAGNAAECSFTMCAQEQRTKRLRRQLGHRRLLGQRYLTAGFDRTSIHYHHVIAGLQHGGEVGRRGLRRLKILLEETPGSVEIFAARLSAKLVPILCFNYTWVVKFEDGHSTRHITKYLVAVAIFGVLVVRCFVTFLLVRRHQIRFHFLSRRR